MFGSRLALTSGTLAGFLLCGCNSQQRDDCPALCDLVRAHPALLGPHVAKRTVAHADETAAQLLPRGSDAFDYPFMS